MAPEMAAHFRRAVHVHLIVDVQFSRTGVLPVMNRYQQRIVQINWICLKRSILQSPRGCEAIGCQARHAVSTGYRSINWKRQVSICPLQLHLQTSHLLWRNASCPFVHIWAKECTTHNPMRSICSFISKLKTRLLSSVTKNSAARQHHLASSRNASATEFPRHRTTRMTRSHAPFARTFPSANETATTKRPQTSRVRDFNQTFCIQKFRDMHICSLDFKTMPWHAWFQNKIERYKIERYNDSRSIFLSTAHAFQWKHNIFFFRAIHHIDPLHRKQTLTLSQCNSRDLTDSPYRNLEKCKKCSRYLFANRHLFHEHSACI